MTIEDDSTFAAVPLFSHAGWKGEEVLGACASTLAPDVHRRRLHAGSGECGCHSFCVSFGAVSRPNRGYTREGSKRLLRQCRCRDHRSFTRH